MTNNEKLNFEKIKDISGYQFKVKTDFNHLKGDYILLTLTASPELKTLLNGIVCKDEEITEQNITLGRNSSYDAQTLKVKRYLVTKPLLSAIPTDTKHLLFEKEFIDTGVLKVKITSFNSIDVILSDFRIGIKALIEVLLKYSNLEATTTFKID